MIYQEGKAPEQLEGYYTWKHQKATELWWYTVRLILIGAALVFILNLFCGGS